MHTMMKSPKLHFSEPIPIVKCCISILIHSLVLSSYHYWWSTRKPVACISHSMFWDCSETWSFYSNSVGTW